MGRGDAVERVDEARVASSEYACEHEPQRGRYGADAGKPCGVHGYGVLRGFGRGAGQLRASAAAASIRALSSANVVDVA